MHGHTNQKKTTFLESSILKREVMIKTEGISFRTYDSVTVRLELKAVIFLSLSRADTEYLT